jgi:hypothetical protein
MRRRRRREMEGQVVEGGEDGGTMEDLFCGDPDPDMIERQNIGVRRTLRIIACLLDAGVVCI